MPTPHPSTPGAVLFKPATAVRIDNHCPVIVPISKNMTGDFRVEPIRGQACPCECYHPQLGETIRSYALSYATELRFSSGGNCDKVKAAGLLDGCYMTVKGGLQLRDSKCPEPTDSAGQPHQDLHIGCQDGEFVMYRPIDPGDPNTAFLPVFIGELTGTVGFDPNSADNSRCCRENWTRGMITGRGVGAMRDCELCATYEGPLKGLDDLDLCLGHDIRWDLKLDGVVICPCPEQAEDKDQKKKK